MFFRIFRAIPVVIGVKFLVFLIFTVLPKGSIIDFIPLLDQYINFLLKMIFEQDLGTSNYGSLVTIKIMNALPATLELVIVALVIGMLIGIPLALGQLFSSNHILISIERGLGLLKRSL